MLWFSIELRVGGGVVLDCIMFKGVSCYILYIIFCPSNVEYVHEKDKT